ncbi:uncharacterized protein AMSG_07805 [Thecamonas trahens ATCC 50062]|uniref:Uncharacterized protein n=1 Tax=Thecamonas trahens ATCC 50062 TaxID=461836 RepID=A0A0L0DI04_THETB|nr:hypothetical protein AMSG_07805 [Thecamonas trahens ATCC 50062]KNC51736.1 hypothetical protein AMSG_07805 [Thecamonas trahens ATCC 50062]|eukprot:XP_013755864.1 hypothetical protein AMSG_07805 [Thecamonas trahens ATCC 50062]
MGVTTSKVWEGGSAEELASAREAYRKAIAARLGVESTAVVDTLSPDSSTMAVALDEEKASKLGCPPHTLVVTFGWSWVTGTEAVWHLPLGSETNQELMESVAQTNGLFLQMQSDGPTFYPGETAQTMGWTFTNQDPHDHGDQGALLVADPVLTGTRQGPGRSERWSSEPPLHTADFMPHGFVGVFPLHPAEYRACGALRAEDYADLVALYHSPVFITSPARASVHHNEAFEAAFITARNNSPTRHLATGVTVDVRLRKNGKALDVVFSGRCMASLLIPLVSAFDKPAPHPDTFVGVMSEAGDTAHFVVDEFILAHPTQGGLAVVNNPDPAVARAAALLSSQELYYTHNQFRKIEATLYAPPAMFARMLNDVRAEVFDANGQARPAVDLAMSWPQFFAGTTTPPTVAFPQPEAPGIDGPYTFRFMAADISYFEGEAHINDDGDVVPIDIPDDIERADADDPDDGGNDE